MSETVKFRARVDSFGFRGYYWEAGEDTEVYPYEMDDPSLKHFDRVSDIPVEVPAKHVPKQRVSAAEAAPAGAQKKHAAGGAPKRRRSSRTKTEVVE